VSFVSCPVARWRWAIVATPVSLRQPMRLAIRGFDAPSSAGFCEVR
jgi:hypothetical protein